MNDELKVNEDLLEVIRLYNSIKSSDKISIKDIEECYSLTKRVLYNGYSRNANDSYNVYKDMKQVTFNDYIKSFIITRDNINKVKVCAWSSAASIVLRDLNTFINKAIWSDNDRVEFTSYLYVSKTFVREVNDSNKCFVIDNTQKYEVESLSEIVNAILKKIGCKRYIELILILACLELPEAPSDILLKYTDVKNQH